MFHAKKTVNSTRSIHLISDIKAFYLKGTKRQHSGKMSQNYQN